MVECAELTSQITSFSQGDPQVIVLSVKCVGEMFGEGYNGVDLLESGLYRRNMSDSGGMVSLVRVTTDLSARLGC